MTFNKWITKWCVCLTFEDTEKHFEDLVFDNLNQGDDMLSYMEEAFAAGIESTKGETTT
tara:strand:+ start:1058 stop:1234 length:177 start_codon:yes stop_codon:yes gene_type:complete